MRLLAPMAILACVAIVPLLAASPAFWTVSSQTAFLEGEADGLSIDSDGRMFLGPALTSIADTAAPFLWALHVGADGTIWSGSGNEGKVLKVARDGTLSTFFDSAELEVHALAPAPKGGLYVATSPGGRIYALSPTGESRVLFDPDTRYIWALASDRAGNLFAATGDQGVIYKIAPDGTGTPFYRTGATHVISLAVTDRGDLIAGTESPGRVFRIDPDGKAFVLLDSPYREIHRLRIAPDGAIYAVAVSAAAAPAPDRPAEPAPQEAPQAPTPSVSTEISGVAIADGTATVVTASPSPAAGRQARRPSRGAIYRIQPDGLWDTVWETGDDAPYDLLLEPDGSLLVGTGTEGKIFRVSGNPARATLLARAPARQVTSLVREASGRIVGATSNPGRIFALSAAPERRGTYESSIRDAGTVASWGAIRWRATARPGQIQIATRSGNTARPDDTWSEWSAAHTDADGEQITSPNARYLQWRAALSAESGDGPILTSVTVAYLPRNLRPEVVSITVHPPGVVFQRPFSPDVEIAGYEDNTSDGRQPAAGGVPATPQPPTPALGRRIYQKGLQTFVWRAEDQNDDRLQYDVSYRREGETVWRPLRRGLWDPIFVWDTTSVPDGTYVIKVEASDAPSNSPATALIGELESTSFDIDNTPPRIEFEAPPKPGSRTIAFVVRDDHSPVQRVEYSLDASRWRIVYPKDGIPDSRVEEFEIVLDESEMGRNVIIRATDAMGNVATAVAEVRR
jgi:outer membrane protein assembly factor BamB